MSNYILECKDLKKYYGKFKVLEDFNLQIESGKIVGLLGVNGCGKSTLFRMINGLTTKTSGEILINGMMPSVNTKKIVSYLPDKDYLDQFKTVTEAVDFFNDFFNDFDKEKALAMLKELNIEISSRISILSKGTAEKLQLILVMSRNAKLYILDEPLAAVDVAAREYIINTFLGSYHKDSTIIIATHLIRDIEKIFDEVVFIKDGKVYLNAAVEEIRNEQGKSVTNLFKEVFKC